MKFNVSSVLFAVCVISGKYSICATIRKYLLNMFESSLVSKMSLK